VLRSVANKVATQMFPQSYYEHQQLRQAMGPFREAGIVFIHVPKTAGMSISQAVYRRTVWCHFTLPQLLKSGDDDVLQLPRFTIIRNSWDRAVSAYKFARMGGIVGGAQMRYASRYRARDFETFDSYVRGYLAVHDVWKLDGVFRPQSYYLGPPGRASFDYIGDFDYMPETEQWLTRTLGRPVLLAHSNATDHANYRTYYTKETRNIVAEVYRCDIDRFGFQF
jgi:chondroitin 4-sulfotransferase 11